MTYSPPVMRIFLPLSLPTPLYSTNSPSPSNFVDSLVGFRALSEPGSDCVCGFSTGWNLPSFPAPEDMVAVMRSGAEAGDLHFGFRAASLVATRAVG